MFIKSLRIGLIGLILFAVHAWAGSSVLEGIVKDINGRPVKGADIRIEAKGGSTSFKTVKTDANGRYISDALPAGIYRVTLVVNGAVKASINNAQTKSGQPTQLNFDLKATASASAKKAKHMVWVPAETGTHLGGRWVEVVNTGNATTAGADNLEKVDGSALRKLQGTTSNPNSSILGH